VLPNIIIKRLKEGKSFFDEEGVKVFITKNGWNKYWPRICYLLNLLNGFQNPTKNEIIARLIIFCSLQ